MSEETTRNYIMNNYKVIEIGYCKAQELLRYQDRAYYTAGVYGWNSDIYIFNGVAISTGYRPFGHVKFNEIRDTLRDYEERAKAINFSPVGYTEREEAVNKILAEFIAQF